MCYHVSTPSKAQTKVFAKEQCLELKTDPTHYFHVNGFTMPTLAVTLNSQEGAITAGRWKLLPPYVKNEHEAKTSHNTLNADSRKIFETASFKHSILHHRGLLWVDGFFEPHDYDNHYIFRPNHEIFSLGIVWAPWENKETDEVINTFSILTVDPNEPISLVHDRMPLVIPEKQREGWLNADSKEAIREYFQPAPDDYLHHHKIGFRVTAGGNFNFPEVQQRHDGPLPGLLF